MRIVAIGGGNNSSIKKDGTPQIYEHKNIDREIILLTNRSYPNVLYVSHAVPSEYEIGSFNKIINTYGKKFRCSVRLHSKDTLKNNRDSEYLLDWADIIYVAGGNTKSMLDLWKQSGFDMELSSRLDKKVLCGTSAGANCWFKEAVSDYLQMETGDIDAPLALLDGLDFVDLVFCPHANFESRREGVKELLRGTDKNALSLTDNAAIEIIDNRFRILTGYSSDGSPRFAQLSYWKDGEYRVQNVEGGGLVRSLTKKY